jgi:uncharacterized protein
VLVARNRELLEQRAAELEGVAVAADLARPTDVEGLIARAEQAAGGGIDVLVNNAGVDLVGDFLAMSGDALEQITRINLLSPMELCRQVLPGMVERGRGHVVNVSSLSGVVALPGTTAYSATKAGISHFTAGLRADLRGLPVRTTLVEIGPVPSDMLDHVTSYRPTEAAFQRSYRLRTSIDTRREVVAEKVAEAVERGRRHVRLPQRAAGFSMLVEAPRRVCEVLLTGVPHRP